MSRTCFACDSTSVGAPIYGLLACHAHAALAVKVGKKDGGKPDAKAPGRRKPKAARGLKGVRTRRIRGKITKTKVARAATDVISEVVRRQRTSGDQLPQEVADAVQDLHGLAFMLKQRTLDGAGIETFNAAAARLGAWLEETA